MTMKRWGVITVSTVLVGCAFQSCTQDSQPHPVTKESIQYEQIDGAEYDEVMSWDKSDWGSPGHQMDTNEYVFFIKPDVEK